MAEFLSVVPAGAEGPSASSLTVTDELNRLLALLRQAFPDAVQIGFEFDGRLQVHIDVRKREQVMVVEAALPTVGGGIFRKVGIGATPHHPFLHRVSATVEA